MKGRLLIKPLTHAVAIAMGAFIAWQLNPAPAASSGYAAMADPSKSATPVAGAPKTKSSLPGSASRLGRALPDFAASWAALSSLPPGDRDLVRWRLLKDWIAEDPDAALEAVLGLPEPEPKELLECFGPLFDKDPDWFLGILQSHRHGLRGVVVRDWWAERMAENDPARLVRLASTFGPLDAASLMTKAMIGATLDQEKMNEAFASLQEMPAGENKDRLWKAAGKGLADIGADILEQRYLEAQDSEVKALFGQALAKALAGKELSPDQRAEILARTPADRRTPLALDLAREAGRNSSAVTAAIDAVVTSADWAPNAKRLAVQLHNSLPNGADALRVATWAASIPARDDTEDLYRTAVRSYLQQRPINEITGWIEAMPPGWRRDNTLAAMVQSNANFQKYEEARWALARIQSPHFRTQGEKWIADAEARSK